MTTRLGAAALLLLSAGAVSRAAGLVREVLVASTFGAGSDLDAVLLGMATPMAITIAMGSALARAAVPAAAGLDANAVARLARWGAARLMAWLLPASLVLALVSVATAPWWVGGDGPQHVALIAAAGAMGALALSGGALAGLLLGLANARAIHAPGAWNPVVYNVIVVACVLACSPRLGALSLAVGILVAEWTQVLWYGANLWRGGARRPSPGAARATDRQWRMVLAAMGPALALALVANANVVVDRAYASGLAQGSVAALGFAERLLNLPVGLMAMAITVPFVTRLGEFKRARRHAQSTATLRLGLRALLVVGAGGGVLLAAFARPVVALLFERGAFDAADTALCVRALLGYSVGTPLLAMAMFLTGAAMLDARPWRIVVVLAATLALNAQLNAAFAPLLGVMGIALSTSAVALVRVVVMMAMMDRGALSDGAMHTSLKRALMVVAGLAPALAIVPAWDLHALVGVIVAFLSVATATTIALPAMLAEARAWSTMLAWLDERCPRAPREAVE